jgi:hypothetical protein
MEEWIGKRLFEVDPDSGPLSRKGGVPGWVWGIVGFTGGYFTAALAAALYWRWLP